MVKGQKAQKNPNAGKKQPAKSSKAAEVLGKSGGLLTFSDYGSLPSSTSASSTSAVATAAAAPGYIPVAAASGSVAAMDISDSDLPPDVLPNLRKLSKRDATTKAKALYHLGQLKFNDLTDQEIKAILRHWPRLFCRLVTDYDHMVREYTLRFHDSLARRAGKLIEPHLKSLVPAWIGLKFDVHTPTSKFCNSSWSSIFPPEKNRKVIGICLSECLKQYNYNLLEETPESLTELSPGTDEEKQARFERLIASSYLSLEYVIMSLNTDDRSAELTSQQVESVSLLTSNKKIWKCASHPSAAIQTAFYLFLAALCKALSPVVEKQYERIAKVTLGCLEKTDSRVCRPLWETVLLLVTKFPECWNSISPEKQVFPGLFKVLSSDSAATLSSVVPNILPFLSAVPRQLIGEYSPYEPVPSFLSQFFQSLRDSFYSRRVDDAHRRKAVECYLVCLRYTLLQVPFADEVRNDDITIAEVSSALLEAQLLPVVEAAFANRIPPTVLFDPLNSFLRRLLKRIHNDTSRIPPDDEAGTPRLSMDLLPEVFWEEMEALLSMEVNRPGQPKAKLDKVSILLVRLSTSLRDEGRLSVHAIGSDLDPAFEPLHGLIADVATSALAYSYEHGSMDHLRIFSCIIRTPVGHSVLRYALSNPSGYDYITNTQSKYPHIRVFTDFDDMASCPADHVAEVFLQWVVFPWLYESVKCGEEQSLARYSSMIKLCLVEVAFAIILHAPSTQRVDLLNEMCRMCGQNVLVLCAMIRQAVLWLQDQDNAIFVQDWLSGEELGGCLVVLVWKATNAASPPLALSADLTIYEGSEVPDSSISAELSIWHSVHLLLRPGSGKELLMSSEHADIILKHTCILFEESLPDRSKALIAALQLAQSYFDGLVEGGTMLKHASYLMMTVFKATCDPDPSFNPKVITHMRMVWKSGLTHFARQQPQECLKWVEEVSNWAHDVLLSSALTTLSSVKELADTLILVLELTRAAGLDTPLPARLAALVPNKERWELARVLAGRSGTCTGSLVDGSLSLFELIPDSFPSASELSTMRRMSANKLFRRRSSDAAVRRASHPAPSVHTQCSVFTCQLISQYKQLLMREHQMQGVSSTEPLAVEMLEREVLSGFYKEQLVGLCTELTWDIQWLYGVPRMCRELYNLDDPDAITWAALPILEPVVPQLLRELRHRQALSQVFDTAKTHSEQSKLIWAAVFQRILEEAAMLGFSVASCELGELPEQYMKKATVTGNELRTLQALLSVMGQPGSPVDLDHIKSIAAQLEQTISGIKADDLCNTKSGAMSPLCACVSALESMSSNGNNTADPQIVSRLMSQVMKWRDQKPDLFFFDCDLSATPTNHIAATMEIMRLVQVAVGYCPEVLSDDQWDFVLCSLLAWFQTCRQTQPHTISYSGLLSAAARNEGLLRCLHFTAFCCHSNKLLCAVVRLLSGPEENVPAALKSSWDSWCGHAVYAEFVPLFMACADTASVTLTLGRDPVITCLHQLLEHLSLSIYLMPSCLLEGESPESTQLLAMLQGQLDEDACQGQDMVKEMARRMSMINPVVPVLGGSLPSLLLSPSCSVQAAAFFTICKMVPAVVKKASDRLQSARAEGNEGSLVTLPADLTVLIDDRCEELESWITSQPEQKQGKQVNIPRANVVYRTTSGYLLAWHLLLLILNRAGPELRAQYASGLRDGTELSSLMKVLFALMPTQPPQSMLKPPLEVGQPSRSLPVPSMKYGRMDHRATLWWNIPEMACSLYLSAMQQVPVLVRQWWNTVDRGFYQMVEKFSTQHISPIILEQEMKALQLNVQPLENMEIRPRPGAREVLAVYTMEEIVVELTIELAQCHPLRPAKVECTKKVGVRTEEWRRWLLQLTTFLANQNGSILDGLALWKKSLDRRFEGIEDCMICFSVIHGSNCSLPKLSCRTCKKKFHSECLYKWFNTSNKSSCPLCRNLF
ncbi:E3 ubiquitin-protein ligase listerin-like isoform X1 [Sycon ciliatum]|uniref:E3 ubiquitin-protein ligase listerin-like isoform X1 n=2 Tax=Sycon ciliatum TaxID=27933 RepID=UPI0031F6FF40